MIPHLYVICMTQELEFLELTSEERLLLLRIFDHDLDDEGFIIDSTGSRIPSQEIIYNYIHGENALLAPGSLEVLDGTPTSISKFLRERVESPADD